MLQDVVLSVEVLVMVKVHDAWLVEMLMNIYDIVRIRRIPPSNYLLAWNDALILVWIAS